MAREGIATLAPYVLVIIIWRIVHDALGYVVFGSGVYVDPITEPLLWLSGMPGRALELLVYLVGPPGPIDAAALGRVVGAVLVMLAVAWVLHAEPSSNLQVRQIDPQTLELQDDNGWLRSPDSNLMRSPQEPFEVGDEVATLDFRVRVLEVADGRPTRISVRFRTGLDDPSFAVVTWTGDDFEPCPAAGGNCPPQ